MTFYNKVAEETNKYAALSQRKAGTVDNNWEDTNAEEIQADIGILIYMGLVDLPETDDYFQGNFYICPIGRQAMTLKQSKQLQQYLHLNDEEGRLDQQSGDSDILYKARPALDLMDKFTVIHTRLRTCCGRGDDWFQGKIFSETVSTWKAN